MGNPLSLDFFLHLVNIQEKVKIPLFAFASLASHLSFPFGLAYSISAHSLAYETLVIE